jgi:FtsH-binding integral membrane protein
MAEKGTIEREVWRHHPWTIVLLIILAICFGIELALGATPLALIGTGLMLLGWTGQLVMDLRRARQQ